MKVILILEFLFSEIEPEITMTLELASILILSVLYVLREAFQEQEQIRTLL
jgi:hypothetical protein